jgi:hypothetical protein
MGLIDNLFMHDYDIHATVKLSDGRIIKGHIPIKARFVDANDIKDIVKRQIELKMDAKVVKVLKMYDANKEKE